MNGRAIEVAIAALRSNQDVLLHNAERTQVVCEQLEANRAAIRELKEVLSDLEVLSWVTQELYDGGSWMWMERKRPEINDVCARLDVFNERHLA